MNLLIDIGNSRAKYAVAECEGTIVELLAQDDFSKETVELLTSKHKISKAIVCSTRGSATEETESVREVVGDVLLFDAAVNTPLKCNYSTPHTLGRDRLALAVGAYNNFKDHNILLIDCGTAITIDFVSEAGVFEGGMISPGVNMRFKALNQFTASLPLYHPQHENLDIARTTESAIVKGVMNGIYYEIEGYISHFRSKFEKLLVIFAGGDLKYFENRIKNTIFADQELLFRGLNEILEYNANKQ